MNFKILIATLLLSYTVAIQLQARSTTSILQALADGEGDGAGKGGKGGKAAAEAGNSTSNATTETECAAEGEFCECDNDIIFGFETKNHTLNRTKDFISKAPKDDGNTTGLMCSADVFGELSGGGNGTNHSCFCSAGKKNSTA